MSKYLKAWSFLDKRIKVVKNIIKPAFYAVPRRESGDPQVLFHIPICPTKRDV